MLARTKGNICSPLVISLHIFFCQYHHGCNKEKVVSFSSHWVALIETAGGSARDTAVLGYTSPLATASKQRHNGYTVYALLSASWSSLKKTEQTPREARRGVSFPIYNAKGGSRKYEKPTSPRKEQIRPASEQHLFLLCCSSN